MSEPKADVSKQRREEWREKLRSGLPIKWSCRLQIAILAALDAAESCVKFNEAMWNAKCENLIGSIRQVMTERDVADKAGYLRGLREALELVPEKYLDTEGQAIALRKLIADAEAEK